MSIRTLIADDEPLARERLRTLLADEPDIEIAGECADGKAVLAALEAAPADLLFLDVHMPGMDGFGVLREIPKDRMPLVIFVTASDQHAVRAFEMNALHYLLKPFKRARLREAVERARATLGARKQGEVSEKLSSWLSAQESKPAHLNRIAVRIGERILFVKAEDIHWIEQAGNYAVLHCGGENHVVRETLTALEEALPQDRFLRVSRSAIVNRERVKELQPAFENEHVVVLTDGTRVPMTRGLREVEKHLKFL